MSNRTCRVSDCRRQHYAADLCSKHYSDQWDADPALRTVQAKTQASDQTARFWSRVVIGQPNECWPWTGAKSYGYGVMRFQGRNQATHRIAYQVAIGPIPDGMQIDHVASRGCTRRDCCNPAHLEPVTNRTNMHRGQTIAKANNDKDRCPQGHPYDLVNTYWWKNNRQCRICRAAADKRRQERRRTAA